MSESVSRAELEAMSRDELIDVIVELDQRVTQQKALLVNVIEDKKELQDTVDNIVDRVDELEAENNRLRTRIEDSDGKDAKVAAIVEYAANKRGSKPAVKLDWREIRGASGCSRRYAYDLMDDLPDEYAWFLTPAEMTQYGSIEIDNEDERRLGIDFEGVHSTACPVNKFTTPSEGEGGRD
jgi:regulator of replication initiation timing